MHAPPFSALELGLSRKPKTASAFMRAFLRDETRRLTGAHPRVHQQWGHHTARKLRERHPNRVLVGTDRAPGSWYESWWAYIVFRGLNTCLYPFLPPEKRTPEGIRDFKAVMYGVTHPEVYDHEAQAKLKRGNEPLTGVELGPWKTGGMWSHTTQGFYGDGRGGWTVDYLIACERVNEGLGLLLGKDLMALPPVKTREPEQPKPVIDDEIAEWIVKADGRMMDFLGYDDLYKAPRWALRVMG